MAAKNSLGSSLAKGVLRFGIGRVLAEVHPALPFVVNVLGLDEPQAGKRLAKELVKIYLEAKEEVANARSAPGKPPLRAANRPLRNAKL